MGAKIITLSQKNQDLLRVALTRAVEWQSLMHDTSGVTQQERDTTERIEKLMKELV